MSTPAPADYVLGRTPEEYSRLTLQGRVLRPYTERFFRAAGLSPGMRVLDIGSGMGDVAMLAADIVGPGGHVTGIDKDPVVLDNARRRAVDYGCAPWVTFEAANIDNYTTDHQFDALVGRYVLLYLPDAGATLERLLGNVKPGGIAVFHDVVFDDSKPSWPPCPLYDLTSHILAEAFERGGAPLKFGKRLGSTFLRAGLPFPTIVGEAVVGGGQRSYIYRWVSVTLMSLAPRLEALGLSLPPELAPLETLPARMEEEAVRLGSQLIGPMQYGAWACKPLA